MREREREIAAAQTFPFPGRPAQQQAEEPVIYNNSFVIQIENDNNDDNMTFDNNDDNMTFDNNDDQDHEMHIVHDTTVNNTSVQTAKYACYVCDKLIDSTD